MGESFKLKERFIPEPKSKEDLIKDSLNKSTFEDCIRLQKKGLGKIQVGCVVEAYDMNSEYGGACSYLFYGCNIHVSDSFGDTHAERMAIDLALKARCFPITIYVTSNSKDENVLLCGSCRHYISEINENCNVIVFNPDGTIKHASTIKDSYPNHKNVKSKNQRFFELCGGMSTTERIIIEAKEINQTGQ